MDRSPPPLDVYPDEEWLTRLRRGNLVFLVKENRYAEVEWPYSPPGPSHVCGEVGLREGSWRDTWFIRPNGRGINGTQCLMPVEGHVPAESPPLPPGDIQHILRRLDRLEEMVFPHRQTHRVTVVDVPVERPTGGGGGLLAASRGFHTDPDGD